MDYKVVPTQRFNYANRIYEVFTSRESFGDIILEDQVFEGTITECDSWIRLKEGGYIHYNKTLK